MVRCANNGFVPISFKLLLNGIPDGLEFTGQTMNLTLAPGTQQLLPFLARNKGGSRTSGDYMVTIQALDEGNAQLAVKTIRIMNVTSARKMGAAAFGGDIPNTVSLRYVSMGRGSSYEQFQTNGKIEFDPQRFIEYRINVDRFQQSGYSGLNIYNTYVDYQSKKWGLKLGNIYENIDFNLGGRGVKATAKLNNSALLSFFGIENKYSLFNQAAAQIPYFNVPDAKAFALDYFIEKGGKEDRRLTYLHSEDDFKSVKADQLSGKVGLKLKNGSFLGFEGGLSREAATVTPQQSKQGFAGGINYILENAAIQFYGSSYYSSAYYTGLRRGIFSSSLSLQRKLSDKNSVKAQVTMQLSSPKFQDAFTQLYSRDVNSSSINIYELQYNTRIGKLYLNVGPYFLGQHLKGVSYIDVPPSNIDWSSSSIRFKSYLNYNGRIHNFSLTADYGYTFVNTSGKPPSPFHSLKMNSSYNIAFVGFTSYIQLNPYYLSDVISATEATKYRLYSFGPNVHFNALKTRLNVQLGGTYNYYGFTQSANYAATGSARLKLKGNWAFTGDVQYSVVKQKILGVPNDPLPGNSPAAIEGDNNFQYNSRQVRLGIEKQFGIRRAAGSKKLELTYFEDLNSNGSRDANEAAVPGVLVKINGEAALTNSNGTVAFKNMNKEAYTAFVTNTKGWSLQEPTVVFLDKNKHLEIPLVKTQSLNGRLKVVAGKYLDSQPVLAGIRISAMDSNGRIHQTLTDDEGTFCFYLPQNDYTVYIETTGMPFSIENGREQVQLKGKVVEMLTFLYKDERRKVGVMRF